MTGLIACLRYWLVAVESYQSLLVPCHLCSEPFKKALCHFVKAYSGEGFYQSFNPCSWHMHGIFILTFVLFCFVLMVLLCENIVALDCVILFKLAYK